MAGKIATRAAYGEALVELAEQYPELVVFDADLSNATMTKGFAAKYPERFFDMGIAECNMTGVAAGMSTCGFKPFTNTFAIFASGRAWEQVRNSIGYPHLNVKVVGSHGGLSVGEDGATHQCTEDLALMRVIPGMKVLCPCDGYEMKLAVKALLEYDGPAYLRLGRAAVETVTDEIEGYKFELDKGVTLKDGKDVTVIATGLMVQMALKARDDGCGGHLRPRHRHAHHQAARRRAGQEGCARDGLHRHLRGAQHHRRPRRRRCRVSERELPHAARSPWRERRLRPQRHGQRRARGLRPDAGGPVRQDPRSAGKETLRFLASALLQRGGGFLLWRTDL